MKEKAQRNTYGKHLFTCTPGEHVEGKGPNNKQHNNGMRTHTLTQKSEADKNMQNVCPQNTKSIPSAILPNMQDI